MTAYFWSVITGTENPDQNHLLSQSFIFPISKSQVLYFMEHNSQIKGVDSLISFKIDILLFIEAKQRLCCISREYLDQLNEASEKVDPYLLRKEIFSYFQKPKN